MGLVAICHQGKYSFSFVSTRCTYGFDELTLNVVVYSFVLVHANICITHF